MSAAWLAAGNAINASVIADTLSIDASAILSFSITAAESVRRRALVAGEACRHIMCHCVEGGWSTGSDVDVDVDVVPVMLMLMLYR